MLSDPSAIDTATAMSLDDEFGIPSQSADLPPNPPNGNFEDDEVRF